MPKVLLAGALLGAICFAQHRVDPRNLYERVVLVVPFTGRGTYEDPRRPLFAPVKPAHPSSETGIIAYSFQESDDGRFALVEYVARSRAAFTGMLNDSRVLQKFEKGKSKREDLERELKRYKKNFDFTRFGVRLP